MKIQSVFIFFPFNNHLQAKKDLSSHCDQIVMSLATLNKQRSVEKQSIRTTVTISKVSKTPISTTTSNTMPITNVTSAASSQSKKILSDSMSEKSDLSSTESPLTVRANSKSPDDIPFVDDINVSKKREIAKEKFFNDSNGERRGELLRRQMLFITS